MGAGVAVAAVCWPPRSGGPKQTLRLKHAPEADIPCIPRRSQWTPAQPGCWVGVATSEEDAVGRNSNSAPNSFDVGGLGCMHMLRKPRHCCLVDLSLTCKGTWGTHACIPPPLPPPPPTRMHRGRLLRRSDVVGQVFLWRVGCSACVRLIRWEAAREHKSRRWVAVCLYVRTNVRMHVCMHSCMAAWLCVVGAGG